jgi:LmbE family N-acetylglucosaminyl deacetylase
VATDPVPELATGRPIIFYTPHQDDETLFMGTVISHHALADREVHVVCATDGSTSAIRDALNGEDTNGYWPAGQHYPGRENIPYLDPAAFAAARDQELIDACALLGVTELHTDWAVPLADGGTLTRGANISVAQAEALMLHFKGLYPTAGHYTMWWGDTDQNHKNLGTALRNLALTTDPARLITDRKWLVRSGQTPAGSRLYTLPTDKANTINGMVRSAVEPYAAWAPRAGRYAIGYHSVTPFFADIEDGKTDRIVDQP